MKELERLAPAASLRGAWCRSSLAWSSLFEAISLVTPALETFFIRAVSEATRACPPSPLRARTDAFVREEARHSAAHRRLNRALVAHLDAPPPALGWAEAALALASARMPLATRLRCVELMEQGSELFSTAYLRLESRLAIACPYARTLFAVHAREEIGHVSVIRALPCDGPAPGRVKTAMIGLALVAAGAAYLSLAVPWIALRKRRSISRPRPDAHPSRDPQEPNP